MDFLWQVPYQNLCELTSLTVHLSVLAAGGVHSVRLPILGSTHDVDDARISALLAVNGLVWAVKLQLAICKVHGHVLCIVMRCTLQK